MQRTQIKPTQFLDLQAWSLDILDIKSPTHCRVPQDRYTYTEFGDQSFNRRSWVTLKGGTRGVQFCRPVVKVVLWSRGGAHLTKAGWSKPHTHSNPTNLALFGHKIALYRFNQGLILLQGGLISEQRGWAPCPVTLTTVAGRSPSYARTVWPTATKLFGIVFLRVGHAPFQQCSAQRFHFFLGTPTHAHTVCPRITTFDSAR